MSADTIEVDGRLVTHEVATTHASEEPMAQWFAFGHLPPELRPISARFAILASDIILSLPRNPERTVALRKLLEAKDAAVRARLAR